MVSRTTPFTIVATCVTLMIASFGSSAQPRVQTGRDLLISRDFFLIQGKRVGLITNHTGRVATGEPLVDVLLRRGVHITALFGPEHGVRGLAGAGERVGDSRDPQTGIPVFSLYGQTRKPTPGMLDSVDVLVYDIQDVGARFYTYISTLKLSMEAAADKGIPFIVLDLPNPLGRIVEGPVLEDSLQSFVGMVPVPVVYGLTCGELAAMIRAKGWLSTERHLDLHVVEMKGWDPKMVWEATGLPWVPPSPNIPRAETADIYPATCIIEATNLSEGRGTPSPFQMVGAPFVDAESIVHRLNAERLPGVRFEAATFTPTSSKWSGQACEGVSIIVTDRRTLQTIRTGLTLVRVFLDTHPEHVTVKQQSFNRLMGSASVYRDLLSGVPVLTICQGWEGGRQEYLRASIPFYRY